MAIVTLDFGQKIDLLNQHELRDALREDAAMRAVITGVKQEEQFFPTSQIGTATQFFVTPVNMVSGGYMWAVMNIGLELSSNVVSRVYKGVPPGPTPNNIATGAARMVAVASASATPNLPFAKGQLTLRAGEQLTILSAGVGNLLSVFITAISIPAERFGELLI